MTVSILVAGALFVMRGDGFTIGMLVAFQMFAARMAQPMLRIASLWQEFQQANIAVKRLGDIMNAPAEPHSAISTRAAIESAAKIEFRGVSFRHRNDDPFLYRNLSVSFSPGALILLTGPSGCGKSTLAKLMLGFYQPSEGRLLLDGHDLQHLSANELRGAFGVVLQETVLFSGTLYDNLGMANPAASPDDIVAACKRAEIHDAIERLPKGYRTEIGEHGVGLSGGTATAHRDCARPPQEAARSHFRRGNQRAGSTHRGHACEHDQSAKGRGDDLLHCPPGAARLGSG
jgi:subfamily B ATP-binding cassette protein HlyB/CyaB